MHVTDVSAIPVEVDIRPLEEDGGLAPYVGPTATDEAAGRTIIKVDTSEGVTGWGEMFTVFSPSSTKHLMERDVADQIVGKSPWEIGSVLPDISPPFVEVDILAGGVEMAMWDVLGKYLGTPLHTLLGGKTTDRVEFAYAVGLLDPEESRSHVHDAREMGFPTVKTKIGGYNRHGRSLEDDVRRLKAMDEEAGDELVLRADGNQTLTPDETVRLVGKLESNDVFLEFIEQPIRIDDTGSYKRLRERLRTPIGVNEDLYYRHNFYQLATDDAVDVGVIDMVPAGGIIQLRKLAAIAEQANISLAHHCGMDLGIKTAAILHTVAATPAINLASDTIYFSLSDFIIEEPFQFEDGSLAVPDTPGLGIRVDEDAIERHRLDV